MFSLIRIVVTATFVLFNLQAIASPSVPKEGLDYIALDTPLPANAGGKKANVVVFFAYFCPHCNLFDAPLSDWVKKHASDVDFKRVHVVFDEGSVPYQRLYYSLLELGKADELQSKVFYEIHVNHHRLNSEAAIADFIEKQGIDRKIFLETYNSKAVQEDMLAAKKLQADAQVHGVPVALIDGRYLTGGGFFHTEAGGLDQFLDIFQSEKAARKKQEASEMKEHEAALKVMDYLVATRKSE